MLKCIQLKKKQKKLTFNPSMGQIVCCHFIVGQIRKIKNESHYNQYASFNIKNSFT